MACSSTPVLRPTVLVVTAISTEASPWLEHRHLGNSFTPVYLGRPLRCSEQLTLCALVSGSGQSNGLAAVLATGLSPNVDLSASYV